MTDFIEIFHNKILGITLLVWFMTQTTKVILGIIEERRFNFKWFIGTGGMPSSHSAGVAALATATGLEYGFASTLFAIAAVFAIVTMFDAQGVRRSTGQQAAVLNRIVDEISSTGRVEEKELKEFVGHTPVQVLVGFALGVIFATILY